MSLRFLSYLFIVAFLLNFVWEFFQAPFYQFSQPKNLLWYSLRDGLMIVVLYLAVGSVLRNWRWGRRFNSRRLILLWVLGAVWAIALEYFSLDASRWTYSVEMPLLPFLNVGLWPVLQMLILPTVAIILTRRQLVE